MSLFLYGHMQENTLHQNVTCSSSKCGRKVLAFLRMFGKTLKQKTSHDKGPGRKVIVSGPARTLAFPKCCAEAGQRARSVAFIGNSTLRRLGSPVLRQAGIPSAAFGLLRLGYPFRSAVLLLFTQSYVTHPYVYS